MAENENKDPQYKIIEHERRTGWEQVAYLVVTAYQKALEKPAYSIPILLLFLAIMGTGASAYLKNRADSLAFQAEQAAAQRQAEIDQLEAASGGNIFISGGDEDDATDQRSAALDDLLASVEAYPLGEKQDLQILSYFSMDPLETESIMGRNADGSAVVRGRIREVMPGSPQHQAYERHVSGQCIQQLDLSSCPVLDRNDRLVAAVYLRNGSVPEVEEFISATALSDGLETTNGGLMRKVFGNEQ